MMPQEATEKTSSVANTACDSSDDWAMRLMIPLPNAPDDSASIPVSGCRASA